MAHAGNGGGHNSDTGDGGETHGSSNIEDTNQARVSEDDGSSAEQEPVRGGDGAGTSPEDESQEKGSSSDEEHEYEASNTEDQEHEPAHEEDQEQESSTEQNIDAEQGSLPVNNMTRGIPPTEEIQPIQEIQPMQEIQPVQEMQPVKEVDAMSTVDQPEGALASDETPAVEGSSSWKLWRCWEGTLDCCGTCLVDPECVRDVFNVETPELRCVSRLLDRIYQ